MRAHAITTSVRRPPAFVVGAVAVLMLGIAAPAATSTGVTAPTPRAASLTLSLSPEAIAQGPRRAPAKWLTFNAVAGNGSKVVVRGDVKRTTERFGADTSDGLITAKLKHSERLRGRRLKVTVKGRATDQSGQTASDKVKYVLRRCPAKADFNYGTSFCNMD